jgi:membrane fusion protein (multidrug efflux system)
VKKPSKSSGLLAVLLLCLQGNLLAADKPQGLPAEVIKVTPQPLERTLEAVGSLMPNEGITLRPEQTGRVSGIHFEEGQQVGQGDKLFTLEASTYLATLKQAQARKNLSEVEYRQAEKLLKKQLGSTLQRDRAQAQLQIDRAQQELAQANLNKMILQAPFTGLAGLRQVSIGDYVSAGQALVELVDLSQIKVEFRIPEIYLPQVEVGQSIKIKIDAFADQEFLGQIYAIAPQVDLRDRSLTLRAHVPNKEGRLFPGLFARIQLILERKEIALMVPEQAIMPQRNGFFIYKVMDGKVELTPVLLGLRRRGEVEILSGLKADDIVVTAGQLKLQPGAPLTPIFVDKPQIAQGGS